MELLYALVQHIRPGQTVKLKPKINILHDIGGTF